MASSVKSPTVVLPPPSYSYKPFFSPSETQATSSFFETSEPTSPLCSMERSIRQVMTKYGVGDLHGSALLPSYRSMRRRRPQEENQAVAVTHDEKSYKIMVDVRDFTEGSVSVKPVGDNELVVEGIIEKKEESSKSENCKTFKSTSKNFQQRFMFPGLQVDGVTSTVSSDGVLTITAPRKVSNSNSVEYQLPVSSKSIEDSTSSLSANTSSQNTNKISLEESVKKASQEVTQHKSTSSIQEKSNTSNEHIVPIEVEDSLPINQSNQQISTSLNSSTEQLSSKDSTNINQLNSIMSVPVGTRTLDQSKSIFDSIFKNSHVPIDNKGLFFQDSFFENSRRHFQEAVDKVMQRVSTEAPVADPLSWYDTHRSSNLVEDTRAGTITTEEKDYKIVLDVRDFEEGSINVRAVGDSEILAEGKMEKKTEGTSIAKSFRRRFVMPGSIKCESITSALSSDGVLTITAPKQDTFKLIELTGENANMSKNALTNSSIFGFNTPSCASPSNSMPLSSVTTPTAESCEIFQPVFSKIQEENHASLSTVSPQSSSGIQNTDKLLSEQKQESTVTQTIQNSSKVAESSNREHMVPIGVDQTSSNNSQEKVVNINYIDKNQSEIDAINRRFELNKETNEQYQLIGNVKDLTDANLRETVKQRKTSTQSQGSREIAIKYDDPSSLVFPPIIRRGPFYQDSFFSGVQQNFQSAIRQVLDRWVDVPSISLNNRSADTMCNFDRFHNTLSNYRSILDCDSFDDLTCYKNLRHRSLNEENQAASLKENDNDFQIVLDVHGFSENDLNIKATSHNELIVDGKVQSTSQGSQSCHSFKKQFILPGPVRMEAVHSALSADDILTITVPKNTLLRITDKENI